MNKHEWDANLYGDKHAFVWHLGAGVVELLNPQAGELVLDLGCGSGELTAQIAQSGAEVMGLDASASMLDKARQSFPNLRFEMGDGANFDVARDFDAVFSNAALHWIPDHVGVARSVSRSLKQGGRFVGEFGGQGNVALLEAAFEGAARELELPPFVSPNRFPTLHQFAASLEAGGLRPIFLQLFDRPTPLVGTDGARNWLRQFRAGYLDALPLEAQEAVLERAESLAKPHLWRDGGWFADYVRLRFVALKS